MQSDIDDFKRLLLGMEEYYCALCAQRTCIGVAFVIHGNSCELTYFTCLACSSRIKIPATVRCDSTLAEIHQLMRGRLRTSTSSNVYTFRRD
jgi:hypothetical protein